MSIPDSSDAGPYPALCFSISIGDQNQNSLPANRWYLELQLNVAQSIYQGYNALQIDTSNIKIGHWLSTETKGQAWKVISISYQDTSICRCIVEDVEWYNASNLSLTEGGPQVGQVGYVFTLGEDGLPVLYPIDPTIIPNATFVTDLIGHFRSRNYYSSYVRVYQANSNFQVGNVIFLTSTGSYQLSNSSSSDVYNSIGIISSVGLPYSYGVMSTGYFTYRPFGQYLTADRIQPSLTGPNSGIGAIYYLSSTGSLTTTSPSSNAYPVYIQVSTGGDGILLKNSFGISAAGGSTGAMGMQGFQGYQGYQGDIGMQGFQGYIGLQGYQGIQGSTGERGFQGDIGMQGLQGIQGSTGERGFQGDIGMQGLQGNFGLQGFIGYQGIQGFQGLQGLIGYQGNFGLQGFIGYQGLAGIDGTTGTLGSQGFQGNFGLQGDIGLQGLIGATGSSGLQGDIGLQGLAGLQGDIGLQGLIGATGERGYQGSFGLQGFIGLQGLQGLGSTGERGYQGNFGLQGEIGLQGLQGIGSTGERGYQGNFGLQGEIGFQGLQGIGSTGERGYQGSLGLQGEIGLQGLDGNAGADGVQGFQGEIGPQGSGLDYAPMFTVDLGTGLITIASSTGGNPEFIFDTNTSQLQLGTGSSIGTISEGDTVFIDGNLNVYNVMTVDAGSGITSFMNYTGGVMVPAIEIDPINKEIIMMSGSSITSYNPNDTVFIDANLNVYNSLTVDALTGITSIVAYTGGDLVPAIEFDPYTKQMIMMSGSSITSYNPNDTVFIDANLNVYNSLTVDALSGISSFVAYTGGDLVPAVEIDPYTKQIIMMSGSSITSYNPNDTVFIDANLNVYNSLTVDALSGISSFVSYTGGNLVPAIEIDPINKEIIMMSGSSITSYNPNDTVFIDANLNVYNSLTVDALSGISSFVAYTGGDLVPAIEIDPINKEIIMMSGSSIISYNPNDTVFIDSNLNVYNSFTVDALSGIASFVSYTGSSLVPAIEIDPINKEIIMMSGSSITSYNPNDTVFIDANLNVYNSLTVDALSGITTFGSYTGSSFIPSVEIDPLDKQIILMTGTTISSVNITDTVFVDANLNVGNIFTVDQVTGLTSFNFYTGGNMYKMASVDIYGNIMATGTTVTTQLSTTNIIMNNYFKSITVPYTGASITINSTRGKFGYSDWSSTGSTALTINNNKVTSDSSVFTSISNSYTSTNFPTVLATIPSSGSFRIIFSNGVSLNGTQFDIDFFVIN